MLQAKDFLQDLNCSLHCWTDSQVVLGWLTNPDLNLSRFVKRRVEKILQVAPGNVWKYLDTSQNPADVGTRDIIGKNPECIDLWLGGPVFFQQEPVSIAGSKCVSVVCMALLEKKSREESENSLDQIISTASDLYTLKKRLAYLVAFAEYVTAKFRGTTFKKPELNADFLDRAHIKAVKYVQSQNFGAAIDVSKGSPDNLETFLKRRVNDVNSPDEKRQVNELKALRNLCPCVANGMLLRVDG